MPAFLLPDLGEGLTEAEIAGWHVQVGDTVAIDQIVVEVETAKAVVEIPVPFAGEVSILHGKVGEVINVGSPLITVTAPATLSDSASGNVLIGYGTPDSARRRRRRNGAAAAVASPVSAPANANSAGRAGDRIPVVSPIVRRLARDAGLELRSIEGSGADGLITRQDVERAVQSHRESNGIDPPPAISASPAGQDQHPVGPDVVRIPIRGLRKTVADKLARSRREIPEATVWVDVDATGLLEFRASLNADQSAPKISLLALISRFTVLALQRYPELNSRIEGEEIVVNPTVNLGFAAQTDRGLMVPVVPAANALSIEQLSNALAERTARARDGRLTPAELTGGTFTVNNYGVFGVDGSAAIINHPEVGILGIGRIIDRPWVVDGQVVPRRVTELTLAFDHRVCDGGVAGGFLRFIADCVESPSHALRHL